MNKFYISDSIIKLMCLILVILMLLFWPEISTFLGMKIAIVIYVILLDVIFIRLFLSMQESRIGRPKLKDGDIVYILDNNANPQQVTVLKQSIGRVIVAFSDGREETVTGADKLYASLDEAQKGSVSNILFGILALIAVICLAIILIRIRMIKKIWR